MSPDSVLGVSAHSRTRPGHPALVLGDRVLTYSELDRRSDAAAVALEAKGVGAGEVVAVMLPNCLELFENMVATAKLGARYLPVNWHLKGEEVEYILTDSGAAALVTQVELAPSGPPCPVITVGAGGDYEESLIAAETEAGAQHRDSGIGPSFNFYTSGTTSRPKGVVRPSSEEEVRQGQLGQIALWSWEPDDVHLLCGPAYHAGPGGWTATALAVGATTVVMSSWDPGEWLRLVETHRVTRAFMVPAHFIRLLELGEERLKSADLSSLELIVHAAAPCPVAVKRRIMDALAPAEIHELYGASEGGATRISPSEWLAHPGSVGRPWPGVEIRILGPNGESRGQGEHGVIWIKPPGGGRFEYHGRPELTAQSWRDDAFTVGDVGFLDADGYLYITDRVSDLVLWGGVNIAPREIEEVLHSHEGVIDCAVFGVPDDRDGERVKAMVEVRPGVTVEELAAHTRAHLADYKVPRDWELVELLPRDPNGKVLKRHLRDAHWGGRDSLV
ncbi:MAG: AMP-binding protein [Acidimicrobiales bacterium]